MKEADVKLTAIPQANGQLKNRPAIYLREMPLFKDALICGISTQLQHEVKGFDEIVRQSDPDFAVSGLVQDSLIRLGFLAVIPRNKILGTIGSISKSRHDRLLQNLGQYLLK